MTDDNGIDLGAVVSGALEEVFETMLSMELEPLNGETDTSKITGHKLVGWVSFGGKAMGNTSLHLSKDFARLIGCTMLGVEPDDIEDEEVEDVIGEVSNMVGGTLTSYLRDCGFPCELSIPSIASGSDFKIDAKGWVRQEVLGFRHHDHIAIVKVVLRYAD